MARIDICTILVNGSRTEHQTIYWDTEDKLLHSDIEPEGEGICPSETLEQAKEDAYALWAAGGVFWDFEWIEDE